MALEQVVEDRHGALGRLSGPGVAQVGELLGALAKC